MESVKVQLVPLQVKTGIVLAAWVSTQGRTNWGAVIQLAKQIADDPNKDSLIICQNEQEAIEYQSRERQ